MLPTSIKRPPGVRAWDGRALRSTRGGLGERTEQVRQGVRTSLSSFIPMRRAGPPRARCVREPQPECKAAGKRPYVPQPQGTDRTRYRRQLCGPIRSSSRHWCVFLIMGALYLWLWLTSRSVLGLRRAGRGGACLAGLVLSMVGGTEQV